MRVNYYFDSSDELFGFLKDMYIGSNSPHDFLLKFYSCCFSCNYIFVCDERYFTDDCMNLLRDRGLDVSEYFNIMESLEC